MQNLYDEVLYQKEFIAEIIDVLEKDNKYHIELDKTYFSPMTTDNPCDSGTINNANVTNVYKEKGKIYHIVDIKPTRIHKVKCTIDFEKKYYYMKKHLGQHIISACFFKLLNGITQSINIENEYSYVDIDKIVTATEIKKVEEMANKIVLDNIKVETLYPTNVELKKLSLKKVHLKPGENIRLVKIGDIDVTPCSGIHPHSTIEVQMIKISNWSKHENCTRVEFICGSRAVSDYLIINEKMEKMSSILHCTRDNLLDKVQRLTSELNKAIAEKTSLRAVVAEYEVQEMLSSCEQVKDIRILKSIYDNVDLKYIIFLASKLVTFTNVIVLFGAKFQDKAQLIFMCSKNLTFISMSYLLKDAITLIDGKGGGSEFSAQGGGKSNNNLDSSLLYAYNKIKSCILMPD